MFRNFNVFLRTIVLAGALVLGGWWTLFLRERFSDHRQALDVAQAEIESLSGNLQESEEHIHELNSVVGELRDTVVLKEKELEELSIAMSLLKIDHRIARIDVISQEADPDDPDQIYTQVRFIELDSEGQASGPGIEATLKGKTVYVETLVVKFGDEFVESGDALRGTSICLFRRLFGEAQSPNDGVEIDPAGLQPLAYTGVEGPSPLHRELWSRFWEYANDPELAEERGVKAIHGEAPFIEARPGKSYRVELRASGGLTIHVE
jgi:hypothetical protein